MADPETEDFVRTNSGAGANVGPVGPGEAEFDTEDAWKVDDPGGVRTYYRGYLTPDEILQLGTIGDWFLTARLHVTDTGNPADNSRYVSFVTPGDPGAGMGKEFCLNFGSDALGNPIVENRAGDAYEVGSGGFHECVLAYDCITRGCWESSRVRLLSDRVEIF